MTRLAFALAFTCFLLAVVIAFQWKFTQGLRAENAQLRATIEGTEDAQDALDDVRRDGAPEWMRKVFGD